MGVLATTAPTTSGRTYTCRIAEIRSQGDDDDREAIDDRMDAGREAFSDRSIAHWLKVAEGTVTKHRTGNCQCYRNG